MQIILLLLVGLVAVVKSKEPPVISENFQCNTQEVSNNETVLHQFLAFDADLRRSNMEAVGSLVKGGMQQIKRCDLLPHEGWFSSAGGPNPIDANTWTCTNSSIPRYGELPYYCQYGTFWSFPPMHYVGPDTVNGVDCDRWEYMSGGDTFAFWAIVDSDAGGDGEGVPVASGKVSSPNPDMSLYTIYFTDFVGTSPKEDAYAAADGCECPDATPMTAAAAAVSQGQVTSVLSLAHTR